ncbi:prepilin-type N-terminal cleavage/methylation domain-containing protein [Hydrogenovibrio thermophilus]|uniref:Type II secretion system protein GspH n=1 Tax=Hydrogenovibrio thermophilus TaxID=265883 RepID=A0A451G548_9GAMM|nr:prepilin-type N-terminal cleavage/methylation domain-containing protein [Hydrogenovibrio thermophilus]QAB14622.1 type II secretion system protein GspH [Hydrogenovibrio thermophilus]
MRPRLRSFSDYDQAWRFLFKGRIEDSKAQGHQKGEQKGFTLIELMVVVVIVAILLTAVVISIQPSESSKVRQQIGAVKGWMQSVCDRATFDQHIYVMMPTQTGMTFARQVKQAWSTPPNARELVWLDGLTVDWQINDATPLQQTLPKPGWLCWPSGEMLGGELQFTLGKTQRTLRWNAIGQFEESDRHER